MPGGAVTEPSPRKAGQRTPSELGVHPAIGGGPLPFYVGRPHDDRLRAVLDPQTEYSRLVVVRGHALTGTSRAVYEAVTEVLADWTLEDLASTAALAARLQAPVPARTVLWLGDLRHHADADGGAAVLGRLDNVLDGEGPVVAIATIWPGYWDSYTAAAATGRGAADPAAAAGRLLAPLNVLAASLDPAHGGVVDVPDRFAAAELTAAADAGDPALAAAVTAAGPDGQVTQYLAGARELLDRYNDPGADPRGRAVVTAAMDAVRLGHAGPLPADLLRDAAAGYLADPSDVADAWDTALAWATGAGSGSALRPVPSDDRSDDGSGLAGYRVAGYLDQHGRRTRGDQLGPASLWDALAARAAGPSDLDRLARAARDRGLYRHAAALWTAAVGGGRTGAGAPGRADTAAQFVAHLSAHGDPGDVARAARWAAGQTSLDEPWDVARLVAALHAVRAGDAIEDLLARDLVGRVGLEHQWDVAELFRALGEADEADAARALVVRVAGQVKPHSTAYLGWLLRALHATRAAAALHALAAQVAADTDPEDVRDVARLLRELHAVGETEAVQTLGARAVEAVDVAEPYDVASLLTALRAAGADEQARNLLARDPGRHASLEHSAEVADLVAALHAAGAADALRALAARAAAQVSLEDGWDTARLLRALRTAGQDDAVRVLLARDPAGQLSELYPPYVADLLTELHAAGAVAAVRALAVRVVELPDYYVIDEPELVRALRAVGATDVLHTLSARVVTEVGVDDPELVAELFEELRDTGAADAAQLLLDGDPASHVGLDDPWELARLLDTLHQAGAADAVRTLAERAAHGVPLHEPGSVARLLQVLRKTELDEVARVLASRAADGAGLEDPQGVARLLEELRAAGASEAIRVLLARGPGRRAALDASQPFRPGYHRAVARLLAALREAGAAEAGAAEAGAAEAGAVEAAQLLAARAADAGMFSLFLDAHPDQAAAYRYGREPDGAPAQPWTWSEPAGP
jgi:hypothetical protein